MSFTLGVHERREPTLERRARAPQLLLDRAQLRRAGRRAADLGAQTVSRLLRHFLERKEKPSGDYSCE
jgi:hypothetical protein